MYSSSARPVCLVSVVSASVLASCPPCGGDRRADFGQRAGQLHAVARRRPLGQERGGHRGEPLLPLRDERITPLDHQVERQQIGRLCRSAIRTSRPFESFRRATAGGVNFGVGPTAGITERSKSSLTATTGGFSSGSCRDRSTVASGARGVGEPGITSSRTRWATRYLLATRFTSSGVTAKIFLSSFL